MRLAAETIVMDVALVRFRGAERVAPRFGATVPVAEIPTGAERIAPTPVVSEALAERLTEAERPVAAFFVTTEAAESEAGAERAAPTGSVTEALTERLAGAAMAAAGMTTLVALAVKLTAAVSTTVERTLAV